MAKTDANSDQETVPNDPFVCCREADLNLHTAIPGKAKKILRKLSDLFYGIGRTKPSFKRHHEKLHNQSNGCRKSPEYDLVFVLPPAERQGWILDAICREIDRYCDLETAFCNFPDSLPPARSYFFSHYGYFRDVLLAQSEILNARNLLFYTHPRTLWYTNEELMYCMGHADVVVSMSSMFAKDLIDQGLDNVEVVHVGADEKLFKPHQRGSGTVGFCASYYPRKNAGMMLDLVRNMPDVAFVLCGRHWAQWPSWPRLLELPNFEYVELAYEDYPGFYSRLDVFVSVSRLEGGPVPLIEAMMSNVVPVASRTGHAPDLIDHGVNGYLFEHDADINQVTTLVRQALESSSDISTTVEQYTWRNFSNRIQQLTGIAALREAG